MNADDYFRQLKNLSPTGKAWEIDDSSELAGLLKAWANELAVFEGRVTDFINNQFPDSTVDFINDWERVAGLPDPCSGLSPTLAIRQKDLVAKLAAVGGQTPAYFISIAASLGYTITITEFNPFRVSISAVGDPLNGADWQFAFQVNAPLNTVEYFKVNHNAAGDALATWANARLECLINAKKPAHTVVIFSYT